MEGNAQTRKDIICGQYKRGTEYRDIGSYRSSYLPEAIQPNLSSYDCSLLWIVVPPPERRVSAYEHNFMSWIFKRAHGYLVYSHLFLADGIPTDFHSQILCGLLFLSLVLQAGSLVWGWAPSLLKGYLCNKDKPQNSQVLRKGVGPVLLASSSFLPVSTRLPVYVFSYKTSVQLVFTWLLRYIVIWFSCNFDLVLRDGECNFHLLCCHLGSFYYVVFISHYHFLFSHF